MTQKKDKTKKFKSSSTGEECTTAQYVAEQVCLRRRQKENKGSLEYKFWNSSQKTEYQIQIRVANKIIKKYGEDSLLHYLRTEGSHIYSLGFLHSSKKFVLISKWVEDGVKKSASILEAEKKKVKKVTDADNMVYRPRKTFGNKNILLNKIRKAEDGK